HALLDLDDDGLVHLVGHNVTTCGLASVALASSGLGVRGLRQHLPSSLASAGFGRMSSSRSLSTVEIPALSRRTPFSRLSFSTWPVAAYNRRSKHSALTF